MSEAHLQLKEGNKFFSASELADIYGRVNNNDMEKRSAFFDGACAYYSDIQLVSVNRWGEIVSIERQN